MSSTPENGYSSIPREEGEQPDSTNVSVNGQPPAVAEDKGVLSKMRRWWVEHWGSSAGETAPLINRQRMTLEPPKKSNMRVAFEIVGIVGTFTLIAAIIVLSIAGGDEGGTTRYFLDTA